MFYDTLLCGVIIMVIEIDRKKIHTERQFFWKKDIIDLAVQLGTVPVVIRDNFNCYIIIGGDLPDIEILDAPKAPVDANVFPALRIYTCGMTINAV